MISRTILLGFATSFSISTHAFQISHRNDMLLLLLRRHPSSSSSSQHFHSIRPRSRPSISSFSLILQSSASEKETPAKPVSSVIESLLESGNIDGAISELRREQTSGREIAPSLYHAIIEACCAGGGGGSHDKRYREPTRSQSQSTVGVDDKHNDRLEMATSLVYSMATPTPHAYDILISGFARRGRCSDALNLLQKMEETFPSSSNNNNNNNPRNNNNNKINNSNTNNPTDLIPSLTTYQTVLLSLATASQFDQTMSLLTHMRRRGIRPTIYTYNSLLNTCAQSKPPRWKEALSFLSQCQREPGITPDLVSYTTAMRACARARKSKKALEIFRVIQDMGMELDVYCYTTAMNACANDGNWKTALALMEEMAERGISPNEFTYSVAITACGNGGQWSKALELLDKMRSMNMKINTITYNSAISALAKAARTESKQQRRYDYHPTTPTEGGNSDPGILWRHALEIIDNMEREGVKRDVFTFSSAINTCGAAGRWEEAVDLIRAMKEEGGGRDTRPNKVTYTSAIVACGNSGQWNAAFDLFNEMKREGLRPDLVAYNALIAAGMNGNKPDEVFDLWIELCQPNKENISPDVVTLTEVTATLDRASGKASREKVDIVFAEAVQRGIILREDSLDRAWEVDLSGMSFPVARAACRFIFRRLVQRVGNGEKVEDLSLITGASRMREYVREVLRDELTPAVYCVVPKLEQGTLQVKAKVMMNYIEGQKL